MMMLVVGIVLKIRTGFQCFETERKPIFSLYELLLSKLTAHIHEVMNHNLKQGLCSPNILKVINFISNECNVQICDVFSCLYDFYSFRVLPVENLK